MIWDGRPKFPVGTIFFEKSGPGGTKNFSEKMGPQDQNYRNQNPVTGINRCGQRCLCFLKIALIFFDRKRLEQSKGFDLAYQVAPSSVHHSRLKYSAIMGSLMTRLLWI